MAFTTVPISPSDTLTNLGFDVCKLSPTKAVLFYLHVNLDMFMARVVTFDSNLPPTFGDTYLIANTTINPSDLSLNTGIICAKIDDTHLYVAYQMPLDPSMDQFASEDEIFSEWVHLVVEVNENDEISVLSSQTITDTEGRIPSYSVDAIYLPLTNQIFYTHFSRTWRWTNTFIDIDENFQLTYNRSASVNLNDTDTISYGSSLKCHLLPDNYFITVFKKSHHSKFVLYDSNGTEVSRYDQDKFPEDDYAYLYQNHFQFVVIDSYNFIVMGTGDVYHFIRNQEDNSLTRVNGYNKFVAQLPNLEFAPSDFATIDNKHFIAYGVNNTSDDNFADSQDAWYKHNYEHAGSYEIMIFSIEQNDLSGEYSIIMSPENVPHRKSGGNTVPFISNAIFVIDDHNFAIFQFDSSYRRISVELFSPSI